MPAAVESMFSAREVPWHGLGKITDDVLTAEDALKAAGLDWEVKLVSTYAQIGKSKIKIPDRFATVRTSDDTLLGSVGGRYTVCQNRDAFAFADALVDSGDAKYETAGSLAGGKVVFLTMKVPNGILIGGEDKCEFYIMLRNSHNGSTRIGVFVTPIRVVCQNTLSLGIAQAQQRWEMRHDRSLEGKLAEARNTLQLTFDYIHEFEVMGNELISTKVTDAELTAILEAAIPARPKTPEVISEIVGMYHDSPTNSYQGTGWGAFNAVTEYFDHVRETRSLEARFTSIMDGGVADIRNRTAELLLAK